MSWFDAVAYCRWLSEKLGYEVRLPTEQEWQQAATGGNEREFPWGNEWRSESANTIKSNLGRTTAVGVYPAGASPVGALDMAGNVWEWCLNLYVNPSIITTDDFGSSRVLRGGSWHDIQDLARAMYRNINPPGGRSNSLGFRVCCSFPIE